MIKHIVHSLLFAVLSFTIMVLLTFWLIHTLPGNPFAEEGRLSQASMNALIQHYGLDKPLPTQLWNYIIALMHGDLGTSLMYPTRSVIDIIADTFPISFMLGLQAIIIAVAGGISLGLFTGWQNLHQRGHFMTVVILFFFSLPSFLVAILLQLTFGVYLDWLPLAGMVSWTGTLLPSIVIALHPMLIIARLIRARLLACWQTPFIAFAFSKGLSDGEVLLKHALPHALPSIYQYLGQISASIVTGSLMVEKLFGIPGLGSWYVASILNRDYTVILGTTLFYTLLLLLFVLLSELLSGRRQK